MSRKAIAFIVVPLLLIGGVLFSNFLADQKELPPQRPRPVVRNYVKVRPVSYSKMPVEIEAFGRLNSLQQINLIPEVSAWPGTWANSRKSLRERGYARAK